MDAAKIERLKKTMENNPDLNPRFKFKRTDALVQQERQKIYAGLKIFIESKRSRSEYSVFMSVVQKALEARWKLMLTNPEAVLYISQLKFLEDKTKKTKTNPFYFHMLNTALLSLGIMVNTYLVNQKKYTAEEMADIVLVALLHSARGWENAGDFIELNVEERRRKYIEANEGNHNYLKKYGLSNDVLDAIGFCYQFQTEKFDFYQKDTTASHYAQIVCVASLCDEMTSGLWDNARTPREVVDALYVKANEGKIPKLYVDALAKGLKFNNLFDFYHQLEILINSCHRKSSKPYPMTGFKSPIIFVCSNNMQECKEYVSSAKAINIFKKTGGLEEGTYGRCEGLSSQLIAFYDEHYHDIKEKVIEKAQKTTPGNNKGEES